MSFKQKAGWLTDTLCSYVIQSMKGCTLTARILSLSLPTLLSLSLSLAMITLKKQTLVHSISLKNSGH